MLTESFRLVVDQHTTLPGNLQRNLDHESRHTFDFVVLLQTTQAPKIGRSSVIIL